MLNTLTECCFMTLQWLTNLYLKPLCRNGHSYTFFFASIQTNSQNMQMWGSVLRGRVTPYVIGGRARVSGNLLLISQPHTHAHIYTHSCARGLSHKQTVSLSAATAAGNTTPATNCSEKWSRRDVKHEMPPFTVTLQWGRGLPEQVGELWQKLEKPTQEFLRSTRGKHSWNTSVSSVQPEDVLVVLMRVLIVFFVREGKQTNFDSHFIST